MADRATQTPVEVRLDTYLQSELSRAQRDFPALPNRPAGRSWSVPIALGLVALGVVLALLVIRPLLVGPSTVGGPRLGGDGLPLTIDGQQVLRGEEIAARMASGEGETYFLAGGRLVWRPGTCGADPACAGEWWLEEVERSDPAFQIITVGSGVTFVETSGALSVFRVAAADSVIRCRRLICADGLVIESTAWRQPTRGRIPSDSSPAEGGAMNVALVPDFVSVYGQDGETVAGYVPKEMLFPGDRVVPGTPDNPPQDDPLPVYGEDLTTLVGYMVADIGFVPVSAPAVSCALARDCDAVERAATDAVADLGHVVAGITIEGSYICLADPFHPISCPFAGPAGAADFIGSAVVEFLGVRERAYLNLYHAQDGSIIHRRTVQTPPVESG